MRFLNLKKLLAVLGLAALLLLCCKAGFSYEAENKQNETDTDSVITDQTVQDAASYLEPTELDRNTEMTDCTELDLSACDGVAEITEGGNYHVYGELNGKIRIQAEEQNVHLFLDNVSLTSKYGPAIVCEAGDKLIITLNEGTQNLISDSGDYRNYKDEEACIYSVCDITFNGTGSLNINGLYKDAVYSKDIVKIMDGTYEIKCKEDGIHGNDGIRIAGGILDLSSEENGFVTTKTGEEGKGDLIISSGELNIAAGEYSFIVKKADLYIYNCKVVSKSIVDIYKCGGQIHVQEECVKS